MFFFQIHSGARAGASGEEGKSVRSSHYRGAVGRTKDLNCQCVLDFRNQGWHLCNFSGISEAWCIFVFAIF